MFSPVPPADYVLVKQKTLSMAVEALSAAGHVIRFDPADLVCGPPPRKLRPLLVGDFDQLTIIQPNVAKYTGLWSRVSNEEPPGTVVDSTTLVWWLQAGDFYIDIRIPREGHRVFTHQRSFAGVLEYVKGGADTDIVQWHRLADFSPKTTRADMGRNVWGKDRNSLQEFGHPSLDYKESWVREGGRPDAFAVLMLEPLIGGTRFGCWIFCGKHWARVLGRTCSLREHLDPSDTSEVTEFCKSIQQLHAYYAAVNNLSSNGSDVTRRVAREKMADWTHSYSCECGVLQERSEADPLLRVMHALERRREGRSWDLGCVLQRDHEAPVDGPLRLIEFDLGQKTDSPLATQSMRRWRLMQAQGKGPWSRVFSK